MYFECGDKHLQAINKGCSFFSGSILLVEDEKARDSIVCDLIEQMGVTVIAANNGESAVQKWQKYQPSLIVIDLDGAVLDGLTAMRTIRYAEKYLPEHPHIPIIALAVEEITARVTDVGDAGGNGLITKPFEKSDFVCLFEQYLSQETKEGKARMDTAYKEADLPARVSMTLNLQVLNDLKVVLGEDIDILYNAFFSDANGVTENLTQELKKPAELMDLESISRSGHSMKSISQNVGAEALSAVSEQLESLAKEKKVLEIQNKIQMLLDEYNLLSEALNEER